MEFKQVIKDRYSCKKFEPTMVEKAKLEAILEAGRLAPTARNAQEQKVYVLTSKEHLDKVDKATPCRYGAPVVLVVAYDKKGVFTYPGGKYDSGAEDATIVATQLTLAAEDEGVNSCWLNYFDPDALREDLGLPEDEVIVMLLDLGYAAPEGKPLDNHFSRKPLSETTIWM